MDYKQKYEEEEDNMITEDYCSQEVFQLLREKGFPVGVGSWSRGFVWDGEGYLPGLVKHENSITHQMAMKWLRKMHNVHIVIEYYEVDGEGFYGWIVKTGGERYHCHQEFSKDYEEAVEAALKHCLTELI